MICAFNLDKLLDSFTLINWHGASRLSSHCFGISCGYYYGSNQFWGHWPECADSEMWATEILFVYFSLWSSSSICFWLFCYTNEIFFSPLSLGATFAPISGVTLWRWLPFAVPVARINWQNFNFPLDLRGFLARVVVCSVPFWVLLWFCARVWVVWVDGCVVVLLSVSVLFTRVLSLSPSLSLFLCVLLCFLMHYVASSSWICFAINFLLVAPSSFAGRQSPPRGVWWIFMSSHSHSHSNSNSLLGHRRPNELPLFEYTASRSKPNAIIYRLCLFAFDAGLPRPASPRH